MKAKSHDKRNDLKSHRFCLIQDELETVPLCPILSNNGRNMHQMRTGEKSMG